ncbi:MAG: T9SS C-terminal target domain-containing protein [Sphingobacteriia bacterium]|nr:MAG: T9SS C-terminal target domain-containing protein [Sphingobacteriia bacterium]TAG29809.1 MAG: T9SS C-terminal target domain-containing protein [Sphingobacteriia bacterium]TAH06330.1 MAG: T9SS C-terminal target domain-containing protein [Sphingobacteriia bacterium]
MYWLFKLLFLLPFLCCNLFVFAQSAPVPIGNWRAHLNYSKTIQVLKGDQIYCATETGIFAVDGDKEISLFHKINSLNDIGVSCIGWDETTQQLVIAYQNSNLDLLKGSIVKNIGDILRTNFVGNKSISHIYCNNGIAYLSTGMGIIVVDLKRFEIKDTWLIGSNGSQIPIAATIINNGIFYAATTEGLKTAPLNSTDLSNYQSWILASGKNRLPEGNINFVGIANDQVVVQKKDSLLINKNNQWSLLYSDLQWPINNTSISENKILVAQRTNGGNARVVILNSSGMVEKILAAPGIISLPKSAFSNNNSIWVADYFGGLSNFGNSIERYIPNGPPEPSSGAFAFANVSLFQAAGSINNAWNYRFNKAGILRFEAGYWNQINVLNTPILDSVFDFITLAIDPSDESIWAGSYGGGLAHFETTKTSLYKQRNSNLEAAIGDLNSYRVSGLAFDKDQNLWISNYGAPQPIKLRKKDGSWKSFSIPFTLTEQAVAELIHDDFGNLWIMSPKNNGLICFNNGGSINNNNDDQWKYFRQGMGAGNLPSNNILSIVKDKSSSIWVGTDDGIGLINCTDRIFGTNACEAVIPIIQQGEFAGRLLKGEQVQCMAVDAANRKWIGTQNGVWLLSEDGKKIMLRFNTNNSFLLSNDVKKIGIDPQTGEVYFATFNGLCSFRSEAIEAVETMNNILVFPNPVPPGYDGTIAIRGLTDNAIVKITDLSGRLVFQTRSLGGQAIWNGRNYKGNKIASGIYLVLIRDYAGNEKIATKIIITSGR